MLNHNIISIILKKAHKCHCWQDSIKNYCADHVINIDDLYYMSMEQYADFYRKKISQQQSINFKILKDMRTHKGYTIIIHGKKDHGDIITFHFRYISPKTGFLLNSKPIQYNKNTKICTYKCICRSCIKDCYYPISQLHRIADIPHILRHISFTYFINKIKPENYMYIDIYKKNELNF